MPRSRRPLLRTAWLALATMGGFAGCLGDEDGTAGSPTSHPETASPSPDPWVTSSPTASPEWTPTDDPIGTGDNPADVTVGGVAPADSLTVTLARSGADDPLFEETVRRDDGRQEFDVLPPNASGVYVLTVRLDDGTERSIEWDLSGRPEGGWWSVGVADDGSISMHYAIA